MSCSVSPENIVKSYFWVVFMQGLLLASASGVGWPAEYQVPRQPELQPIRSLTASNDIVEWNRVALDIYHVQSLEVSTIETAIKDVLVEMLDGTSLVDLRNLTKENIFLGNTTLSNGTVQTSVGVEIPGGSNWVPAEVLQLFLENNMDRFRAKLEKKLESSKHQIPKVEVPDWTAAIIAVFSLLLVVVFSIVIRHGCLGDEELFKAEKNSTGAPTSIEDGWISNELDPTRKSFSQQFLVNNNDNSDDAGSAGSRKQSTEL